MAKTPPQPAPPPQPAGGDALAALKAQILGGNTGASGTTDYIGFPANTATLTGIGGSTTTHPQPLYAQGSQWLPVRENATPQDISQLQDQMVKAGLLTTDYRAGVWDAPSMQAFTQVLGAANAAGSTWQQALTNYTNGTPMVWDAKTNSYVKGTPGTAQTKAPLVTRYTNPDDLASVANEVATSKIGRMFTPDEMQRFVKAYHDTEATESAGQSSASGPGGGGYTAAASPQTAAATFAQQTDPTAYNAEQFLPLVQKMNDLLAGPHLQTTKPMSA
jgi:hypothetical protein